MNFLLWIITLLLGFFGITALKQSPPPVSVVEVPKSVSVKADPDAALLIQANEHNWLLRYKQDSIITNSKAAMISFIRKYRFPDANNIIVKGNSQLPYQRFRMVKDVLRANDIVKFRIVTTDDTLNK